MYLTFIGVSFVFLIPSVFFLINTLCRKENNQLYDQKLEITFLKNQLYQIENDRKNGVIFSDQDFTQISLARKLLKLNQNPRKKPKYFNTPVKSRTWLVIVITFILLGGTHITYFFTSDNFFKFQSIVSQKNNSLDPKLIKPSQTTVEELIQQRKIDEAQTSTNFKFKKLEQLVNDLKTVLSNQPNDLRGQKLLVKNSILIGDFITARKAKKKVLELLGTSKTSSDYAEYAELCVIAASGYTSPDAINAIKKALFLDSKNSQANFYLSLYLIQDGNMPLALKNWEELINNEQSSSKWIMMIARQLIRISTQMKIEINQSYESKTDALNLRVLFFAVLTILEKHLDKYGGSIETWVFLIQNYENLAFTKESKIVNEKVKNAFSLSNSKLEQLKNNME